METLALRITGAIATLDSTNAANVSQSAGRVAAYAAAAAAHARQLSTSSSNGTGAAAGPSQPHATGARNVIAMDSSLSAASASHAGYSNLLPHASLASGIQAMVSSLPASRLLDPTAFAAKARPPGNTLAPSANTTPGSSFSAWNMYQPASSHSQQQQQLQSTSRTAESLGNRDSACKVQLARAILNSSHDHQEQQEQRWQRYTHTALEEPSVSSGSMGGNLQLSVQHDGRSSQLQQRHRASAAPIMVLSVGGEAGERSKGLTMSPDGIPRASTTDAPRGSLRLQPQQQSQGRTYLAIEGRFTSPTRSYALASHRRQRALVNLKGQRSAQLQQRH